MPTSYRYDSTRAALALHLPSVRPSQLDTLATIVAGVVQSGSIHLHRIARAMPSLHLQASKEQRLRRFLDNPRISPTTHFAPVARAALRGLKGQRVHLVIDRVLLRSHHNLLVVSVGFRRRALPLSWKALDHIGASGLADQQALITQALAVLPDGVRVTVHGDSEFRSQALFYWLRAQGFDVFLGVRGDSLVAWTPSGQAQPLANLLPSRSCVGYLNEVYLSDTRHGPVNVMAWWERDETGKLLVRGVMTNRPASWRSYRTGGHRMHIEPMFRDWQSGGFDLEHSGIQDRTRLERLILPLALAYLWLVSVGRWLVKRGLRGLIDDGPAMAWRFGLFQLGVGWKDHCASCGLELPVLFYIYT